MKLIAFTIFSLLLSGSVNAGEVYDEFPSDIDPNGTYVFYLHGLIVEGKDPAPVHPKYGVYEFMKIKNELSKDSDFSLIAHHRPKNTKVNPYVKKLVSWVNKLVNSGVDSKKIFLVGFSRGGEITSHASSELKALKINTVLLATCWKGGAQDNPSISFAGNFLSVYETSDGAKSCKKLADRSLRLGSFSEIPITTGREHGAFFKPLNEWVEPLKSWIESKSE